MSQDACLPKLYGGTWSIDNFPAWNAKPSCYIINLSPSWHPGSHWTAVYRDGRGGTEYFCSYGSDVPDQIRRKLMGAKYRKNVKQLQCISSDLCGQYCILYLLCKCRGFSYKKFQSCFSSNHSMNDQLVDHVFKKYIRNQRRGAAKQWRGNLLSKHK
jgi:hypothetical protein